MYAERNEDKRKIFEEEIKDIPADKLVFIDESGIDHNAIKEECWAQRGKKIIGNRSGKIRKRTSVIAALNGENINAPMRLQGSTTTVIFVAWVQQFLVPSLIPGQVVIMDNAAFHKSAKIREEIEKAGCSLKYLPPYSPDLNPIENYWAALKKYLKKIKPNFMNFFDAIDHALQNKKIAFN